MADSHQWVKLAVTRVNQCHTRPAVDAALRELPKGMEAMYSRMVAAIVQMPNPDDIGLAMSILQCVTCSLRVLTLVEISQALPEVTSEVLDIQRTIIDLCGDFIVIDHSGNVALVHQTARDYLIKDSEESGAFQIDKQVSHTQMFRSCLNCLTATGLRAKLGRGQRPEFLDYAAVSWSSHLVSSQINDRDIINMLKKFLTSTWVLTWVHALALGGQLKALIRASKDLSRYAAKSKRKNSSLDEEGLSIQEQELIESWSVDLLRILGKFSNLLRRKPDSIYKFIPPFCPHSSSIYQLFGKAESSTISISGLSSETWDDSLARISIGDGPGTIASYISASGSMIAALSPKGNVFMYDSTDFNETKSSPIEHKERVSRMALNRTATLLATYGYRTTKVWDVSTGQCRLCVNSIESRTRPLALMISEDNSKLLVGTDDRRVRSMNLTDTQPTWKIIATLEEDETEDHFKSSASHMALNSDGSMVAVAYRHRPLSAWETGAPEPLGHCWRKDQSVAIRELRDLEWHPQLPMLLGLNLEGVVFKWLPYEGEVEELPVLAANMCISRDGNLFATGDAHGRLKLYSTSTFSIIYRLAAQDPVLGMTFSPDSRRFYDIRGSYANAWEPGVLLKIGGTSLDSESDSFGQPTEASSVVSRVVDTIKAVAGSPNASLYVASTERGVVSLRDTHSDKVSYIHVSMGKFLVDHIAWSDDGSFVCFSDLSRTVRIVLVTRAVGEDSIVEEKAAVSMRGNAITQLLFSPSGESLLVSTVSECSVISLTSFAVEATYELAEEHIRWSIHPLDQNLILGLSSVTAHVLSWTLDVRVTHSLKWPDTALCTSDGPRIDRVLFPSSKKHLLLQMSAKTNIRQKSFFLLGTSQLQAPATSPSVDSESQGLSIQEIHADLSSDITVALAFLSRHRLLYISKTSMICSVQLSGASTVPPIRKSVTAGMAVQGKTPSSAKPTIQELFALPGDWISKESMAACGFWTCERALLYPRNGEVAVIRCAAFAR